MAVSSWHVLQPTLQATFAFFVTSFLTFIRPINFSLACLSTVFVLVLHILLVQNFHVGTLLLSAASLLGTVWSGIAAAGIVVSICMQIPVTAGHIALLVVLASTGFALASLVRVSARQFPLLFLQGTNLLMTFGMSLVLAFWAPTVQVLWSSYLAHMLLAFLATCLASVLSGLLVLPSLATAEAMRNVITALNRTGQTGTMCVSILLAPLHLLQLGMHPGDARPQQQQQHLQQQQSPGLQGRAGDSKPAAASLGMHRDASYAALRHDMDALETLHHHQQQQQRPVLQHQASLLYEEPLSPRELSSIMQQATQPGQWGLRSFLAANSAAADRVNSRAEQPVSGSSATATAGLSGNAAGGNNGPHVPNAVELVPISGAAGQPAAAAAAAGPDSDLDGDWGHDHYEEDLLTDIISADANVQVRSDAGGGAPESLGVNTHNSSSSSSGSSVGSAVTGTFGAPSRFQHQDGPGPAPVSQPPSAARHIRLIPATAAAQHLAAAGQLQHSRSDPALTSIRNGSSYTQRNDLPRALACKSSPHLKHDSRSHHSGKAHVKAGSSKVDQRHPLIRLQRGVDQIRPLLQATKQLQAAVTVEQEWWVGLLVRLQVGRVFDAAKWGQLVEALEALLNRVAALESMLEGGHDYSSLAQLTSYQNLAATCGAVFAQAAALCGVVSTQLSHKLEQTQHQGDLLYMLRRLAPGACGRRSSKSSKGSSSSSRFSGPGAGSQAQPTPGTTAKATGLPTGSAPSSAALPDLSTVLCSPSCFDWGLARQHLIRVLEFETQQYHTALVQAARDRPFKLDPARSMTSLMYLCMLSMGVIDACQRLQDAAHNLLGSSSSSSSSSSSGGGGGRGGPSAGVVSTEMVAQQQQQQQQQHPSHPSSNWHTSAAPPAGPVSTTRTAGVAATSSSSSMSAGKEAAKVSGNSTTSATASAATGRGRGMPGTMLLLRTILMVDVGLRIWDAVAHQLPAACKSKAALRAQLSDRRFQAGFKAWLASTIAIIVIAASYAQLGFLGRNGPSIFMFGFMSLVFTMRERVESSMEMVMFRVGATAVGACLGHALMFHPATAYNPYLICAVNVVFCLLVLPFSLGQFKLVVVLGLLTFASVTLCQYAGCCGAVGNTTYLAGRILATGGGSLFAMVLNRVLWPWRRNRWAMEEFSKVLGIAALSAGKLYAAEYRHLAAAATNPTPRASVPDETGATTAAAAGQYVLCSRSNSNCGQAIQQAADAVVIELPLTQMPGPPAAASAFPGAAGTATADKGTSSAAGLSLAAAAAAGVPAGLAGKSPEELQQMCAGILVPVQISIARDTWIMWKKGALAVAPAVPVMLLAVQQLVDALSALLITHKLITAQPTSQQPPSAVGADGAGRGSSGSSSRSPAECVQWQQELLLHELVQPIHGSFSRLLQELSALTGLVGVHVRKPTDASRAQLNSKIQEVHDLRVSVSLEYIQLRNQRHRKMRQQLSALWHERQQHQQQQHQQQGQGQAPQMLCSQLGGARQGPTADVAGQSGSLSGGGSAAGYQAGGWGTEQPGWQHQVLSIVQYMAFVHALRRFFDRAVAVARCAADAQF